MDNREYLLLFSRLIVIPLGEYLIDQFHLWNPELVRLLVQIVQVDLALKLIDIYVAAIVRIQVQSEHISLVTREINSKDVLDSKQDLTGVN